MTLFTSYFCFRLRNFNDVKSLLIWNATSHNLKEIVLKTLKNRESIHIAKFAHDTRADTFFEESIHYHELILGMIRYIRERKGRPICNI